MKYIFIIIGIVGTLIIEYLSIIIPNNPFEIIYIPSIVAFNKPLWLCIFVSITFIYLSILYAIYDTLEQRKTV